MAKSATAVKAAKATVTKAAASTKATAAKMAKTKATAAKASRATLAKKAAKAPRSPVAKVDIHREVTDSIIRALKGGTIPWCREGASIPVNLTTGKAYHGLNVFLLWMRASEMGYASDRWLTFKQGEALKAHVRKGEKGVRCIKYTIFEKTENDAAGRETIKRIPMLSSFTVFHESQFDDMPEMPMVVAAPASLAGALMEVGAHIEVDSNIRYDLAKDCIRMPTSDAFEDEMLYAATLAHQYIHWTGAAGRMERDLSGAVGTPEHAVEEMVAEMGAAFLCAEYGVPTLTYHAEMVEAWLEVLEADKGAVFKAASKASKAVEYLHAQRATAEPAKLAA